MGWLDTKESHRHQNVHVIAKGNINQADRIHQRERRRQWFIFLDVVMVFCILLGILFLVYGINYIIGIILIAIGLSIISFFILRKRRFRRRRR